MAAQICEDIVFREGARVLLVGSSGAGKTQFIKNVIKNKIDLFEIPPSKILFCSHSKSEDLSKDLGNSVEFIESVPNDSYTFEPYSLVIFDDLLSDSDAENICGKLWSYFCRRCHHEKLYVFVTVQNLFYSSNYFYQQNRSSTACGIQIKAG